ncbi:hypothetical protein CSP56_03755 [Salmonella enterica subsp. enterica serovar Infantis]|nr:hypothetical protein [Salmonella enterica subsp. enterica serovar Infantis]
MKARINPACEKRFVKKRTVQAIKLSNRSVYNYGWNVHIEYLHSVTLCKALAFLSIRLANPA